MVFRISKIHTNADFTFSNNKLKLSLWFLVINYDIMVASFNIYPGRLYEI